jgi:hypothetical protein
MNEYAAFVLSSGRCATQWLAQNLGDAYPDVAEVTHEPLYMDYFPRQMRARPDPDPAGDTRAVLAHADRIESLLRWSRYIECGWPCYAAIPYFARRFAGRLRIVHLTRHPLTSASSMLTHGYYSAASGHHVTDRALPTPWDEAVLFPGYREHWQAMTAFEKCLYFWAELHGLALKMEGELGVPWLRLRYEDLFHGDALDRILDFLDLPRRRSIYAARNQPTDGYRRTARTEWNPRLIERHPRVIEIAARLGYDATEVDEDSLRQRYAPTTAKQRP